LENAALAVVNEKDLAPASSVSQTPRVNAGRKAETSETDS